MARNKWVNQKAILGAGAAAATRAASYFFDPAEGRMRRARLRDRARRGQHEVEQFSRRFARDARQRTTGSWHELKARIQEKDTDPSVIKARTWATLGHYCSHPRALDVEVQGHDVTLSGPILRSEVPAVIWAAATVRGVHRVHNNLEPHKTSENVPGLQGAGKKAPILTYNRQNWPPAYRALAAASGLGAAGYGLAHRGLSGAATAIAGGLLAARGSTNKSLRQIFGLKAGPTAVRIQKTLTINAPVQEVFAFWQDPEEFPKFMRHVHRVQKLEEGLYRWSVEGPAGTEVHWDACVSDKKTNKHIAWETVPGSIVEQIGYINFEKRDENSTILHIHLSYTPPAGALGHVVTLLFRRDPKSELNDDLLRMKSMVELGKRPHDAADRSA